jgi:hypothetical protein
VDYCVLSVEIVDDMQQNIVDANDVNSSLHCCVLLWMEGSAAFLCGFCKALEVLGESNEERLMYRLWHVMLSMCSVSPLPMLCYVCVT